MLLVAIVGSACAETEGLRPVLIRLTSLEGELVTRSTSGTDVLSEDFADGVSDWLSITEELEPQGVGSEVPRARIQQEEGRAFLTLGAGGLYRIVPIEPEATYEFSGAIRSRGVEERASRFLGASFWVAELDGHESPETLFEEGGSVIERHPLPTAAGTQGWQRQCVVFRTARDARSLVIGAVCAVGETLAGGLVDFTDLALRRIDESVYWEHLALSEIAKAGRGESAPSGWQAQRRLSNVLAAEARPSILCLPGETLALRLRVPSGSPRLATGLGPWDRDFTARDSAALEFRARIDGRDVLGESLALAPELRQVGWHEVEVDLAPWAGREVVLELSVAGAHPGVFGAPLVRDASARADAQNVLLVSIDTLRADHLGAYGCERALTPAIDALAARGVLFEEVVAQAPYTLPAHATLFTGQFPTVHGVERGGNVLSSLRSPILAQVLAERGWRTQAFTAGGFLVPHYGFDKGFDGLATVDPFRHKDSVHLAAKRPQLPEDYFDDAQREPGLGRVRRWLEGHAEEPFFLFLHTYEVHDYDPPPGTTDCERQGCRSTGVNVRDWGITKKNGWRPMPITDGERAHIGHLYDAALRHVDGIVGILLADLERLGIAERTVVVLTSDHGEEMFERGFLQHGKTVYGEQTEIPMILFVPGVAPRRSATPCMQVDLAPMLTGALGLPHDPRMQGVDLLRRDPGRRSLWTEVDDAFVHKLALETPDGWKLVHAPRDADVRYPSPNEWELFHLAQDPLELRERSREDLERLASLRAELEAWRAHLEAVRDTLGAVASGGAIDDETLRQLAELGYVDGDR